MCPFDQLICYSYMWKLKIAQVERHFLVGSPDDCIILVQCVWLARRRIETDKKKLLFYHMGVIWIVIKFTVRDCYNVAEILIMLIMVLVGIIFDSSLVSNGQKLYYFITCGLIWMVIKFTMCDCYNVAEILPLLILVLVGIIFDSTLVSTCLLLFCCK
jgi:hypothetical protein